MTKKCEWKWILTPQNLAIIGVYEETYELYVSIQDALHEVRKQVKSGNSSISITEQKWCKKLVNKYFETHYRVFSDFRLHVSDEVLKNHWFAQFEMFIIKNSAEYDYKGITFSSFLKKLEWLISYRIYTNFKNQGLWESVDDAHDALTARICGLVENPKLADSVLLRGQIEYTLSDDAQTIWRYTCLHNLKCNRDTPKHTIQSKIVVVKTLKGDRRCNLPVNYCFNCNEYFIGKNSLDIMQKIHGILLVKVRSCSPNQCVDIKWSRFNEESELYSCGYNVQAEGLSQHDRRTLLSYLIDSGTMNKFEIRRDIEKNITLFSGREKFGNAIMLWKDDLAFIDQY